MSLSSPGIRLPDNRVMPSTRILGGIIVPILITAFVILFIFPTESGRRFAWAIQPTMSAMMLGATYLGGAYFFIRVAIGKDWVGIKLGLLPVSTFAGVLGLATLIHWDKFTHGLFAFQLWAILYLTLPFVIPIVWFLNRGQDPGAAGELRLSPFLRLAMGILGAVLSIAALILLAAPHVMIPLWPWSLTPLTARVMAAMFSLSGFVGLGVAIDGRSAAARTVLEAQVISIVLILIGMGLALSEIAWTSPGAWGLVAGLMVEGGLALIIISRRGKALGPAVGPSDLPAN